MNYLTQIDNQLLCKTIRRTHVIYYGIVKPTLLSVASQAMQPKDCQARLQLRSSPLSGGGSGRELRAGSARREEERPLLQYLPEPDGARDMPHMRRR